MAKSRQSADELSENTRRQEQLEQVRTIAADLKKRMQSTQADRKGLSLLQSVSVGLYDEADKLSKKAPAEAVSELMLEQVNDVVKEAKELLLKDVHVQRLKEFVPAGNNPQMRDVVVILRQIRQGMERFDVETKVFQQTASSLILQADTIAMAVEYKLANDDSVDMDYVSELLGTAPQQWFGDYLNNHLFKFSKLDRTNIAEYFHIE